MNVNYTKIIFKNILLIYTIIFLILFNIIKMERDVNIKLVKLKKFIGTFN